MNYPWEAEEKKLGWGKSNPVDEDVISHPHGSVPANVRGRDSTILCFSSTLPSRSWYDKNHAYAHVKSKSGKVRGAQEKRRLTGRA